MQSDIDRILIPRDRIAERVRQIAGQIAETYRSEQTVGESGLTIVAILAGSVIFLADLMRYLPIRMKIGLVTVSNYAGATTTPRGAKVLSRINLDVASQHVLLLDDILDTGGTLRLVRQQVMEQGPKTVRTCVLLRKPNKAPPDVPADFVGFDIEDVFVVGYGLDYDDHYRNLPDIAVLRPQVYES